MKSISIILSFLFLSFVSNPVKAEEVQQYDYVEITAGEVAPYDGYLFTHDGIAGVAVRLQTKIKLVELQKTDELKKLELKLTSIIEGKDAELYAKKTMYESQLRAKQAAVDSLVEQEKWNGIKIVGVAVSAIIIGLASGFIWGTLNK